MSDEARTNAITPEAILSYPQLHEAKEDDRGKLKYGCALVMLEDADLSALEAAAIAAATKKFGATISVPGGKKIPVAQAFTAGVLRSPFRTDAVAKGYPEGSTFINVKTERRPSVVYPWIDPATGKPAVMPPENVAEELYPGAIIRASVNAFGYDYQGNKGVSFALNNIQFIRAGERLDNRMAATDEFDVLSEEPADISDMLD